MTSRATDKLLREVHLIIQFFCCFCQKLFFFLSTTYLHAIAPDVAALALSGDWTEEFISGPDSAAAPGILALGDATDADWTKEFIAEAAGSLSLL